MIYILSFLWYTMEYSVKEKDKGFYGEASSGY